MLINQVDHRGALHQLIITELSPNIKKIDKEAFYAEKFLRLLGEQGFLLSQEKSVQQRLADEVYLVKEIAKVCMTTAFCLWCHLASLTYIRNTENKQLQTAVLPLLENGKLLGGTGLSNPMKHLAGLENLHLKATVTDGGYFVSGTLPYISNLGDSQGFGFGFVAEVENAAEFGKPERIIGFVRCGEADLSLHPRVNYIGLNGSATYACQFKNKFIAKEAIISEDADAFIDKIRSHFIAYQIPLSLGVMESSITSIERVKKKQNGCNQHLKIQPNDLRGKSDKLQSVFMTLLKQEKIDNKQLLQLRLTSAYDVLEAVQTAMLHHGGSAYLKDSTPDRKLREAYFYANLTPTIKHLEKSLSS